MSAIIKIFELLFSALSDGMNYILESVELLMKDDHRYKAQFVASGTLLSSGNKGFCLTGTANLSVKNSFQNALIVASTGMGKTSVALIPSLYTMDSSRVVHDPSGELFSKTGGFLAQRGYVVKTLNFAVPSRSSGFNPLQRANSSSEIQKLSALLVENALGKNSKDPFWQTQAISMLTIFISILKKQEKEYHNFYNLRQLLSQFGGNQKAVELLFCRYADTDAVLWAEFKAFLAYDDKVVSGVTATAKAALQIFADENVAKVTSTDSIDFADFRKRKTVLFIQNSVADQRYYSVLTSIFFEQFFAYIMSRFPEKQEQDIFFLIDEMSSLRFPTLSLSVANCRKHSAGLLLVVQDFNQLISTYGREDAQAIKSNCFARMYFSGVGVETAIELEKILGKFEFSDKENKKNVRSLMTADEIRIMPEDRAIVICGHHPPIKAQLLPYYKNWRMNAKSKIPPPEIQSEIPPGEIPILPLPVPKKEENKGKKHQ